MSGMKKIIALVALLLTLVVAAPAAQAATTTPERCSPSSGTRACLVVGHSGRYVMTVNVYLAGSCRWLQSPGAVVENTRLVAPGGRVVWRGRDTFLNCYTLKTYRPRIRVPAGTKAYTSGHIRLFAHHDPSFGIWSPSIR